MKKAHFLAINIFAIIGLFATLIPVNDIYAKKLFTYQKIVTQTSDRKHIAMDRFIVKYKDGLSEQDIESSISAKDSQTQGSLSTFSGKDKRRKNYKTIYTVNEFDNKDISANEENTALEKLRNGMYEYANDPKVEFVQPVYAYRLSQTGWSTDDSTKDYPSDWDASNHWYYEDEKLREMWNDQGCTASGGTEPCGGSSDVIVAVIDTGLAYRDRDGSDPDFYPNTDFKSMYSGDITDFDFQQASEFDPSGGFNLYLNATEYALSGGASCFDGVDDDGNTYYDDCFGYNAYEDRLCNYLENDGPVGNECTSSNWVEAGNPHDDYGHGTFVTGLIAGNVDNGESISPAFNVTIMPLKASERITHAGLLRSGTNTYGPALYTDDVCNSVDYAIENDADVINMSFGMPYYDNVMDNCLTDAYNAGITLVAASGNNGTDSVSYPARFDEVIAVGAVDTAGQRASYSNYGPDLDLVAAVDDSAYQQSYVLPWTGSCLDPSCNMSAYACTQSGDVCSSMHFDNQSECEYYNYQWITGCNSTWSLADFTSPTSRNGGGTSYASPQVAAAAGLLLSSNDSLSPSQIKNSLLLTTSRLTKTFNPQTGFGLLNFEAIYQHNHFDKKTKWHNWFAPDNRIPLVGDFDGDGCDDIVSFYSDNTEGDVYVSLSDCNDSFGTRTYWHGWFAPRDEIPAIGDFNGDGKDDIITFTSDRQADVYVALSDGSTFKPSRKWHNWFAPDDRIPLVGDFDGDGCDDIVSFYSDNTKGDVYVSLSDCKNSFGMRTYWHGWFAPRDEVPAIGDIDGDGLDDIYTFTNDDRANVFVAISSGHKFENSQRLSNWFAPEGEIPDVGDFNGDGKDDIITFTKKENRNIYVKYSQYPQSFSSPGEIVSLDFLLQNNGIPLVGNFNGNKFPNTELGNEISDIIFFTSDNKADVFVAMNFTHLF